MPLGFADPDAAALPLTLLFSDDFAKDSETIERSARACKGESAETPLLLAGGYVDRAYGEIASYVNEGVVIPVSMFGADCRRPRVRSGRPDGC